MVISSFVNVAYNASFSEKLEKKHIRICLAINQTNTIALPKEGRYIYFQTLKRLLEPIFIIYLDFESILNPATDNKNDGPNTEKYQKHIAFSYGYEFMLMNNIKDITLVKIPLTNLLVTEQVKVNIDVPFQKEI